MTSEQNKTLKPKEPVTATAANEAPTLPRPPAGLEAAVKASTVSESSKESPACEALVIDDEPANRDFLMRLLEQAKLKVRGASTAAEALQIIKEFKNLTLIVIDNKLPDMDGVELLCQLRPQYPNARLIMATMLDERALMAKAFDNGCDVFLVKPHGFMELFRRLQLPSSDENLKRLVIDQYGPRPYRG